MPRAMAQGFPLPFKVCLAGKTTLVNSILRILAAKNASLS
jgi:hypothetical protein